MLTRREIVARLVNLQRRYDAGAHRSDCADLGLGITDLIRDLSAQPTLPEGWSHPEQQKITYWVGDHSFFTSATITVVGDRIEFTTLIGEKACAKHSQVTLPIGAVRAALELSEGE